MAGLKTAKYVYERLTEQKRALAALRESGKPLPADGWLGRRYLYLPEDMQQLKKGFAPRQVRRDRRRSRSDGELTKRGRSSSGSSGGLFQKRSTGSPPAELEVEVLEQSDLVIVEEIYSNSSRGTSPATSIPSSEEDGASSDSPVVQRTHYKLRTGTIPDKAPLVLSSHHYRHHSRQRKDWPLRTIGSPTAVQGLPYKKSNNPLASYCECHTYAIEESRAMLFPAKSPPRDPFSSCCERCRDKCRVVRDLSNI